MNQDLAVFIVPFAVVIGGGLVAVGGLYFINIRFVNNAGLAVASLVGGAAILGVLEIILAGSATAFFKAQQVQTSLCELQGESAHPEARRSADRDIIHKAIVACMNDTGYEWFAEHHQCKSATVATNPYCYLPASGFDRAVTAFQLRFE
ncbi:MAG: hypothetical protein C3F11_14060 [Methylocystaceae bacterium]|nr:MAG: hypothetical protein C3F11_14060 [Methylocystaceae bacterium]